MKLGKLINAYMTNNGYTLRSLAEEIGCDHTTLHRLVQEKPCRLDTLTKILIWLFK